MVITAQRFFELFILCLSWQWEPSSLTHTWTTVDKVARVLHGLGILSAKQRKTLYRDRQVQGIFLARSRWCYTTALGEETKKDEVLSTQICLVVCVPLATAPSRERMLRDYHIHLTHKGKVNATTPEEKYAGILTREKYFAEIERQELLLPNKEAKSAVIARYREKVIQECKEKD